MKPQEIEKIRQLDVQGMSGTVQSVLLNPNINQASYPEVLYYLISKTLEEKAYLERANIKLTNVLKSTHLYDELDWALELEGKV
jgi:hypothetical protein